ncbi:hypothetical protein MCFN_00665 [Mycoplasmopsis californica]|uniref:NERD domain-containing protein n=1 Tax=Mycoplasmopsis californica TaxID=2113 RepID=A0A059XRA5_9BACT|nr:nuclease-related domain-containing protein [Mycoplasmopsis californica]AIA29298.1 hypothetical protein MCFN_00665 [Mycoplasmopsis californica]
MQLNKTITILATATQNQKPKLHEISYQTKVGIALGICFMAIILIVTISLGIWLYVKDKRKNTQGFQFEEIVGRTLSDYAKRSNYKYIKGHKFAYAANQQFEIDGLLYTDKFVIIVEVKYLQGSITGDVNDKNIKIYNGKRVKKFYNPLVQNLKHIHHFRKMCDAKIPLFSMLMLPKNTQVNFSGKADWSIIATEDNYEEILDSIYEDFINQPSIEPELLKRMNEAIKANKVVSLRDLKKWEKGIKNNAK